MNPRISLPGCALSGVFTLVSGYIILDQMTCSGWYCQFLGLLPAMPWILLLLPFASRLPLVLNVFVLWTAVLVNAAFAYRLGARMRWPFKP